MLDSGHCDKAVDAQLYWYETLYFSLSHSPSLLHAHTHTKRSTVSTIPPQHPMQSASRGILAIQKGDVGKKVKLILWCLGA